MNSKFLGGILLIVGTSIGGGMLALPVVNAQSGFWYSTLMLFLCWSVMTLGAFFILEANLFLPRGKHMVSMAQATLGLPGLALAWFSYLFLLYTLLSAYISGGADVLGGLLGKMGLHLPDWQASVLFTLLFGLIVYGGIKQVDYVNRVLMFAKLIAYGLLVLFISPFIQLPHFQFHQFSALTSSIMILITSFGFAIIVPNLRDYFDDDLPTLRKVVLIGSLIPLFCYIAWDAVIIGSLPSVGDEGLIKLIDNPHTTSSLANLLTHTVNNSLISSLFNFFTSICMLTAFLGVSLCLISFLADGFKWDQQGRQGLGLFLLTFIPPLILVIFYPGAYLHALGYAGIFCVLLLLLLPALMSYFGRKKFSSPFLVPGGIIAQGVVILAALLLLIQEVFKLNV